MNNSVRSALGGTKTEQNLRDALASESHSYTLYSLYADGARRTGDDVLARQLDMTASQEKEHARLWLEYLGELSEDEMLDNINAAEAAEQYDYEISYPEYADVADDEGFSEIAEKFRQVAEVEHMHNEQMRMLAMEYSDDMTAATDDTKWRCLNCGYTTSGATPPDRCPLCSYTKGHYERMN